jgi:hypothetical protein
MEKSEEQKPAGRKVMLVIEDDGAEQFKFYMDGDVERLNQPQIPTSLYSAAEFWGVQFFALCQEFLQRSGEIKQVPQPEQGASNGTVDQR